jgi:CubicO group peptidase (beta-lactamase class C family)
MIRRTLPTVARALVRMLPKMTAGLLAAVLTCTSASVAVGSAPTPPPAGRFDAKTLADIDRVFADYALDAHVPGLVYGIVADGKLVYVRGLGVQDLESKRPVTPDTLFRIASMTKAFTALTVLEMRDDDQLRLDALAESYVPELLAWAYPTTDAPRIRVRDLLNHAAGFVTDDPWGDRQTPLPEADFTAMLSAGVPFARAPGLAYEYSNLGFALLGRIISNVSGHPYPETIGRTLLQPLGMTSSGFVADAAPAERRALGYRWEDDAWRAEPLLGPGAFGAMGGLQTSAVDYAKWVAFLLAAWPARDGVDHGPVRRGTVRELAAGSNFPRLRPRAGRSGTDACRQAANYAMGMNVAADCDLGLTLSHSGGYPGYGSHVLLLPESGIGLFAFANRSYAGPSSAVWDAAMALHKAGLLVPRPISVSTELAAAYRAAGTVYREGALEPAGEVFAMNFLLDRDAAGWRRDLATLKARVGDCDTSAAIDASSALAGEFTWRCAHGRVSGSVLLAPTRPARIQEIKLAPIDP